MLKIDRIYKLNKPQCVKISVGLSYLSYKCYLLDMFLVF